MKHLRDFLRFDMDAFLDGKMLMVTGSKPWLDFETKELLGTVIETTIVKDNTTYNIKDNEHISNRFEKINFKVPEVDLNIPLDTYVKPTNAVAKVYGKFQENLSVTVDSLQILQPKKP